MQGGRMSLFGRDEKRILKNIEDNLISNLEKHKNKDISIDYFMGTLEGTVCFINAYLKGNKPCQLDAFGYKSIVKERSLLGGERNGISCCG